MTLDCGRKPEHQQETPLRDDPTQDGLNQVSLGQCKLCLKTVEVTHFEPNSLLVFFLLLFCLFF